MEQFTDFIRMRGSIRMVLGGHGWSNYQRGTKL